MNEQRNNKCRYLNGYKISENYSKQTYYEFLLTQLVYIHILTYTYIYLHIHTYTYIYIHIHTHTYIYLHILTYTYISKHKKLVHTADIESKV